jgi:hypothetical protein
MITSTLLPEKMAIELDALLEVIKSGPFSPQDHHIRVDCPWYEEWR